MEFQDIIFMFPMTQNEAVALKTMTKLLSFITSVFYFFIFFI